MAWKLPKQAWPRVDGLWLLVAWVWNEKLLRSGRDALRRPCEYLVLWKEGQLPQSKLGVRGLSRGPTASGWISILWVKGKWEGNELFCDQDYRLTTKKGGHNTVLPIKRETPFHHLMLYDLLQVTSLLWASFPTCLFNIHQQFIWASTTCASHLDTVVNRQASCF